MYKIKAQLHTCTIANIDVAIDSWESVCLSVLRLGFVAFPLSSQRDDMGGGGISVKSSLLRFNAGEDVLVFY